MPTNGLTEEDNDGRDVADWMRRRQLAVDSRDQNVAAGRDVWAASTGTGQNLAAPQPDDVRALGAGEHGQDAAAAVRAAGAGVSPDQLAAIVWNETRSLSGPQAREMREQIAHTVLNADAKWGAKRSIYARTAPTTAHVPDVEKGSYDASMQAAQAAIAQHAKGVDPTNGAVFYQFIEGPSPAAWQDRSLKSQQGPFNNSFPHGKLGRAGVYWYAY